MGKRLRVLHRLLTRDENLEVIVTSARALAQKLSIQEQTFPISLKTEDLIDQGELLEKLIAFGYKREYQVEHRGEVAVLAVEVEVEELLVEVGGLLVELEELLVEAEVFIESDGMDSIISETIEL